MKLAPLLLLCLGSGTLAADCFLDQQRQNSGPSGAQIAQALTANSTLTDICGNNWRVDDVHQLNNTFNNGDMIYYIERTNTNQPLRYCQDAFTNIIDQCITNGDFWGGTWNLDGESYKISNNVYLDNGLASPQTNSTPNKPLTNEPPSSTPATFATSTAIIPGLRTHSQTTTSADGQTTVLPIWFVRVDVGIVLVPGPGAKSGGNIPPPDGFPPLVIGPDQTATATATGTTTESSSNPSCTGGSSRGV